MRKWFFAIVPATAISLLPIGAVANQPTLSHQTPFTVHTTVTTLCSFPVTLDVVGTTSETDFIDQAGNLVRIHLQGSEQDTLTANGHSLTSAPYTSSAEILFDSNGNVTGFTADGVIARFTLPDGSLFISAGKLLLLEHPGQQYFVTPDIGHSGNTAALCAALS
jgi:hypothetical protein